MSWRWLIYDHIPRELNIPRSQRKAIVKEARQGLFALPEFARRARNLVSIVVLLLLSAGLMLGLEYVIARKPPRSVQYGYLMFMGLAIHLYCVIVWRSLLEKRTFRILRKRGYNICAECGYLLQGLPDDQEHCPECGTASDEMSFLNDRSKSSLRKEPDL